MVQFTKLRLSGFKSFVDPTELYIDPGLTGVVGPNGCGKSNLVEALRWVMGETSAKRMRGSEMDDVIFAGSAQRPGRNIAEVEISLDNRDRTAPAGMNDTEELLVARRIERDSGSNYRVNGRDVRARDVQLLFADSASGAHSTALVSQGRVGALVNAKPAERRTLLEEAAGITGLHSRRHEAELRLRAAETNLERLDDVIATLEAQLKGLKRQARQASRYRNLAGHIRRNEAILLHVETERAKAALEQARRGLADCEAAVRERTRCAAAASTEQARASTVLPDLRQREASAAAGLQRLLVDRDNLAREEAQVAAAQARAEQHLAEIANDRGRAGAQAEDAASALERLESDAQSLNAAATGEDEARQAATRRLDEAAEAAADGETALGNLTERVAADEARAAALERRTTELAQRLERLKGQADTVAEESALLERSPADQKALSDAAAELAAAEAALNAARAEAETAGASLSAAREEENRTREALQAVQTAQAKLEAEIAALTNTLEPGQSDIWPPILDTLSVEPGLELALGAALGDDLSASADEAAPAHWTTLPPYGQPPALPAGAEPLAALVRGPEALTRRLAQIGAVPDTATGVRLQGALAPGQRLVTREGALWRWDGFTTAAEAPTAAATRLAQRNRLADLRAALPETERRAADRAAAHSAARDKAEQAAGAERTARTAVDGAFGAVAVARDKQAELAQKVAAVTSRGAALEETAERLRGEIGECEAALAQTAGDRSALPDLTAARAEITGLRAQLAERRAALSECQSAVDRLARESDSRNQRLAAIDRETESWTRRAAEATQHLEALQGRQVEAQRELDALAACPAEFAARRDALAAEIKDAEARRKMAADALAEGEARLAAADSALKAEEQTLAQAREDRVRSEAALVQREQALHTLAQRARERLDCGLEELLEQAEVDPGQDLPALEEIESKLARLIRERDNMGPVNLCAELEAADLDREITTMQSERADLISAIARLRQGISSLNREGRQRLLAAFEKVDGHFSTLFERLFGGGRAHLKLVESDDPLEAGLEIMASPPGKRLQVLSLLSGGEQALTALALLFAVFLTNPAPICVLDEVDAPLDDANVDRFCTLVDELAEKTETRFLIITHHRMTMARMDRLFGVTMSERGVSQLVSVDLESAEELRESA
ncbi:MAG: AAA family ATPase [Rhodospirillales bacterium]|nr:AAA family ATPase [Rhodospirillales bacterium]